VLYAGSKGDVLYAGSKDFFESQSFENPGYLGFILV